MSRSAPAWLALAIATLPATAAEPGGPAPSAELLEYLGTWNGDEEWLHSEDLLPAPTGTPDAGRDKAELERAKRAGERSPTEQ
jgi:hypothetical protein